MTQYRDKGKLRKIFLLFLSNFFITSFCIKECFFLQNILIFKNLTQLLNSVNISDFLHTKFLENSKLNFLDSSFCVDFHYHLPFPK